MSIRYAGQKREAECMLKKTVEKYAGMASEFAEWLASETPEGLTVFDLAPDSVGVRRKLITTNMIEFQNKELKNEKDVLDYFL